MKAGAPGPFSRCVMRVGARRLWACGARAGREVGGPSCFRRTARWRDRGFAALARSDAGRRPAVQAVLWSGWVKWSRFRCAPRSGAGLKTGAPSPLRGDGGFLGDRGEHVADDGEAFGEDLGFGAEADAEEAVELEVVGGDDEEAALDAEALDEVLG